MTLCCLMPWKPMLLVTRKLPWASGGKCRLAISSQPHVGRTIDVNTFMFGMLARELDVAGQRQAEVVGAAGGVGDEVLAPACRRRGPTGWRSGSDTNVSSLWLLRLEAIDAGVALAERAPRRLDVGAMEDAFVEEQGALGRPGEHVDGVMAVAGAEAVQDRSRA